MAAQTQTNPANPTVSSSTSTVHANVIPSEVGWQFVPQYYTFVNKHPNRLHMFYTKNSTFIHGTEGEDGRPCFGQQEIHNKIISIGFQDCKVYIHSVDAQSSAAGGIIIQVIGEMSNHGEPWRKFAQTFFLAEQPNGYFVLNDIFRFLKEDSAGDDEESEADAPQDSEPTTFAPTSGAPVNPNTANHVPIGMTSPQPTPAPTAPREPTPAPPAPAEPAIPAQPVAAPSPAPATVPAPAPEKKHIPNGHHPTEEKATTPAPVEVEAPAPVPAPVEPAPATPEPEVKKLKEPTPAPTPARVATPAQPATPPPAEKPAAPVPSTPSAPPAPKTWANLAATDSKKWGSAVAQDAKGVSAAAPAPPPTPTAARGGAPMGMGRGAPPQPQREMLPPQREGEHPNYTAAMSITTGACFVKSVTEGVSASVLKEVLLARFGQVKELDIVRSKACAFLEFTTVEAARRAIIASLPVAQGGEGGIKIDGAGENGGPQRISVEMRKERGDRPPPRPRGGAPPPMNNGGGGGFRGRGGPPTRGRGAPPLVR